MNEYSGKQAGAPPGSHAGLGLRVIEALVEAQRPVGPSELGRALGTDKSVIHRALQALVNEGWVTAYKDPDGSNSYAASGRVAAVGQSWLQDGLPQRVVRETVDEVAQASSETVHFAEIRGTELVCRERRLAPSGLVPKTAVGDAWPIDSRAAVAIAVRAQRRGPGALGTTSGDRAQGAKSDPDVALAQEKGYALDIGVYRDGITAVAAAVHGHNGAPVGALAISGPSGHLSSKLEPLGELAKSAAAGMSAKLGYGAPDVPGLGALEVVRVVELRRDDFWRHLHDLSVDGYEEAYGRAAQEGQYQRAVELLSPLVLSLLEETNHGFLKSTGTIRTERRRGEDGGLATEWQLSWPELEKAKDRFSGEALKPVRVIAVLLGEHIHGHLRSGTAGDWPMQVSTAQDVTRQLYVLWTLIEGELHDRVFRCGIRHRLIPGFTPREDKPPRSRRVAPLKG